MKRIPTLTTYLETWTVHKAWTYGPERIWLHTCDLDHPAALNHYLQAGFTVYDRKVIQQVIPEDDY